jgi:hypothetical protein
MNFLTLHESDLDRHFIGQLDMYEVDDYKTVKAGTGSHSGVIRSIVDEKNETITLVGHLTKRFNVRTFPSDGSVGLYGKITERFKDGTDMTRVDTIYLHHVEPRDIAASEPLTKDISTFQGRAEFDDVLFNLNEEFTFPVTYYTSKASHSIFGIKLVIPTKRFNQYVTLRDVWYRDYKGCRVVDRGSDKRTLSSSGSEPPTKRQRKSRRLHHKNK